MKTLVIYSIHRPGMEYPDYEITTLDFKYKLPAEINLSDIEEWIENGKREVDIAFIPIIAHTCISLDEFIGEDIQKRLDILSDITNEFEMMKEIQQATNPGEEIVWDDWDDETRITCSAFFNIPKSRMEYIETIQDQETGNTIYTYHINY